LNRERGLLKPYGEKTGFLIVTAWNVSLSIVLSLASNPPPGWGARERASFDVKVIGHLDRHSEESSYCKIVNNAEVFLSGKSIGQIVLYPCRNSETIVSIEVAHDGVELVVRKCVEPSLFDDPDGNKIVCSDSPFAGDAR